MHAVLLCRRFHLQGWRSRWKSGYAPHSKDSLLIRCTQEVWDTKLQSWATLRVSHPMAPQQTCALTHAFASLLHLWEGRFMYKGAPIRALTGSDRCIARLCKEAKWNLQDVNALCVPTTLNHCMRLPTTNISPSTTTTTANHAPDLQGPRTWKLAKHAHAAPLSKLILNRNPQSLSPCIQIARHMGPQCQLKTIMCVQCHTTPPTHQLHRSRHCPHPPNPTNQSPTQRAANR